MYPFDEKFQAKVAEMREGGVEPYPTAAELRPTHLSTDLHARYKGVEDPSAEDGSTDVALSGRVMFRNRMGKLLFLRIQDRGEASVPDVDEEERDESVHNTR